MLDSLSIGDVLRLDRGQFLELPSLSMGHLECRPNAMCPVRTMLPDPGCVNLDSRVPRISCAHLYRS